jgi:multiple sugar transport system substrate-binding protein
MATFPAKTTLSGDPDLMAVPSIAALARNIDRYIWPGPMPGFVEDNLRIAMEDIIYNGVDISRALQDAENLVNIDLRNTDFVPREHLYIHFSESQ